MADRPDSLACTIAGMKRDLAQVRDALGLLGAKPCCVCGRFYLTSDPRSLFCAEAEAVCYSCLSTWWRARCPTLTIAERLTIEHRLLRWLVEHHHAKVYRDLRDLPPENAQELHLVVGCFECNGTGQLAGERCRHCLGNRNVWVITLR